MSHRLSQYFTVNSTSQERQRRFKLHWNFVALWRTGHGAFAWLLTPPFAVGEDANGGKNHHIRKFKRSIMITDKILINALYLVKMSISIVFLYCSCMSSPNEMEMTLFEPRCRTDTLMNNNKIYRYKVTPYLVDGYQNTAAHEAKIDSFVCAIRDSTWDDYDECLIPIYKKSKYTNSKNIKNNPHDIYEYSQENDFIYQYRWSNEIGYTKTVQKGKEHFDDVICK